MNQGIDDGWEQRQKLANLTYFFNRMLDFMEWFNDQYSDETWNEVWDKFEKYQAEQDAINETRILSPDENTEKPKQPEDGD